MAAAGRTISIEAEPGTVTIDPAESAVIVVDMMNDFASPEGMFARAGIDVAPIQTVVEPIARVLEGSRRAGIRVVYLKMEYREDLSDLGDPESANAVRHLRFGVGESMSAPDGTTGRILVRGTWNTRIVEGLEPEGADIVVSKRRFSGFYGTELDTILKTLGVRSLVFTGCTTSVCVESTLRDAFFRDYRCLLLADCTAEPIASDAPRTNHDATLTLVQALFGWVSSSETFVGALESGKAAA